jgi:hypothetical protein
MGNPAVKHQPTAFQGMFHKPQQSCVDKMVTSLHVTHCGDKSATVEKTITTFAIYYWKLHSNMFRLFRKPSPSITKY